MSNEERMALLEQLSDQFPGFDSALGDYLLADGPSCTVTRKFCIDVGIIEWCTTTTKEC